MKKTVVIFAGMHKTGSSFIQNTAYQNADALFKAGINFVRSGLLTSEPDCGVRHFYLTGEIIQKKRPDVYWENVRQEIEESSCPIHIIMHEDLFSPSIEPAHIVSALDGIDIRASICFRNHLDYVESKYRELVRRRGFSENISKFISYQGGYLNYPKLLHKWEQAIGRNNICKYSYSDVQNSLWTDVFMDSVPSAIPDDIVPASKSNTSLNNYLCLLHQTRNSLIKAGLEIPSEAVEHIAIEYDSSLLNGRITPDIQVARLEEMSIRQSKEINVDLFVSKYRGRPYDSSYGEKAKRKLVASALVSETIRRCFI